MKRWRISNVPQPSRVTIRACYAICPLCCWRLAARARPWRRHGAAWWAAELRGDWESLYRETPDPAAAELAYRAALESGHDARFEQSRPWLQLDLARAKAGVGSATSLDVKRAEVALGTQQVPPNSILIGLALFMTVFVMSPVWTEINKTAVIPYQNKEITQMQAFERGAKPLQKFMLKQTREADLELFIRISGNPELESAEDVPFSLLLSAYVTSELKTAFQIGFLIFLPFLIIDLVVASVLMSMGMMMLSPMIVSLPFKIMLFVLADGWSLIMEMLAASFYVS